MVYYSQKDPRWKNIPYTIDGDAKETIGYSGCGPTCAAMLVASFCDPSITPPDMCRYAIETGTQKRTQLSSPVYKKIYKLKPPLIGRLFLC